MAHEDCDWPGLAKTVTGEAACAAAAHNDQALPHHALDLALGAVPYVGPISTAPVVLLLSHVELPSRAAPGDYAFRRHGWPLSALHPDAPAAPRAWWQGSAAALIDTFGAQHVANSVAGLFLTPWHMASFDARLRLPSRARMLALAERVASRDATLLLMRGADLWTESAAIASLPITRLIRVKSWRATEITRANLGDDAWSHVLRQIEVHAWLA
jgi:hypothetical protein